MTPQDSSAQCFQICSKAPVIPVIVIDDLKDAKPMAEALIKGGLPVLEITLRTDVALDAIREMSAVAGGIVGAGTLMTPEDVKAAKAAGAQFGVSPGTSRAVLDAALEAELPMLPGAITPSEVMALLELGYDMLKFFPAEAAGGMPMLKSFSSPIPKARFCPTGGISEANFRDYLALPNIVCVGGSWVAPASAVKAGDWAQITTLAKAASAG